MIEMETQKYEKGNVDKGINFAVEKENGHAVKVVPVHTCGRLNPPYLYKEIIHKM
jgi:hypothetical protein